MPFRREITRLFSKERMQQHLANHQFNTKRRGSILAFLHDFRKKTAWGASLSLIEEGQTIPKDFRVHRLDD